MDKVQVMSEGNEFTFEKIYSCYQQALYLYALKFVKRSDIAEEIVQDAFIKVWLRWNHIDPEKSILNYLYTITRNLVFDYLKKVSTDNDLLEELRRSIAMQGNDTEDKILSHDYDTLLQKIMTRLPEQKQKILRLSREKGLTHDEIAAALNISPKTVNNHITQALQIVRHYLSLHADIIPMLFFSIISALIL